MSRCGEREMAGAGEEGEAGLRAWAMWSGIECATVCGILEPPRGGDIWTQAGGGSGIVSLERTFLAAGTRAKALMLFELGKLDD